MTSPMPVMNISSKACFLTTHDCSTKWRWPRLGYCFLKGLVLNTLTEQYKHSRQMLTVQLGQYTPSDLSSPAFVQLLPRQQTN